MPSRTAHPGTATVGEVLTASNYNKLPGGWIGHAEATTDQTGISAETDLTGASVTVTVGASRRIRLTGYATVQADTAGALSRLAVKEGTTQLQHSHRVHSAAGGGGQESHLASAVVTPTAGSHTYKLTLTRAAGTGVLDAKATATNPTSLLVEDLGPVS